MVFHSTLDKRQIYSLHGLSYQHAGLRLTHTGNKNTSKDHMAGNFHTAKFIQVLTRVVQTYHQLPFNFMRCDSTMFVLIFFLEGLQLLFLPSFTLFFQLLLLLPELLPKENNKGVPASRNKKIMYLLLCTQCMHEQKEI